MRRLIAVIICVLLIAVYPAAATETEAEEVTPTAYWDFNENYPAASNLQDSFGEVVRSDEGHLLLNVADGNPDQDHIQIFFTADDGTGGTLQDHDVLVFRFRFLDATFIRDYNANVGLIGKTWDKGDQMYLKPSYAYTLDWQVMYLDFRNDSFSEGAEAWYLVWFWHEAARFAATVEIDYIASFAELEDAYKYVEQRGHNVEPELIVDTTEAPATVPEPDITEAPDATEPVGEKTASADTAVTAEQTDAESGTKTDASSPESGKGKTVIVICVIAAVVIAAAVTVLIVIKKKKK